MPENAPGQLIAKLSQYFISDRLLEDELVDARQRAPILVTILLSSSMSALITMIALGTLYAISRDPLHLLASLMAVLTLVGYLGTLWHFKQHQAVLPAADLYALTTTFATVAPCTITGGMSASPYVCLILIVPVFLFLIAGRKQGMYWTAATIAGVAVLSASEFFGMEFPQVIAAPYMAAFSLATWLTTLSLVLMGLISYEKNVEALKNRISGERNPAAQQAYRQINFPEHDKVDSSNQEPALFNSKNTLTLRPR
jgi:hypothetical protein